jgi:hypothetical protein
MVERPPIPHTWDRYGDALRMFLAGATVPTAGRIALVVGTWLSLMNQGDRILHGELPWLRILLNYATPFTVASLGFLSARRRENVEQLTRLLEDGRSLPKRSEPD